MKKYGKCLFYRINGRCDKWYPNGKHPLLLKFYTWNKQSEMPHHAVWLNSIMGNLNGKIIHHIDHNPPLNRLKTKWFQEVNRILHPEKLTILSEWVLQCRVMHTYKIKLVNQRRIKSNCHRLWAKRECEHVADDSQQQIVHHQRFLFQRSITNGSTPRPNVRDYRCAIILRNHIHGGTSILVSPNANSKECAHKLQCKQGRKTISKVYTEVQKAIQHWRWTWTFCQYSCS